MKNLALILLLLVGAACSQQNLSPTETAKIVVESFYNKDNQKLKEYTTAESYESYLFIQDMIATGTYGKSDIKVLQEKCMEILLGFNLLLPMRRNLRLLSLLRKMADGRLRRRGCGRRGRFELIND